MLQRSKARWRSCVRVQYIHIVIILYCNTILTRARYRFRIFGRPVVSGVAPALGHPLVGCFAVRRTRLTLVVPDAVFVFARRTDWRRERKKTTLDKLRRSYRHKNLFHRIYIAYIHNNNNNNFNNNNISCLVGNINS